MFKRRQTELVPPWTSVMVGLARSGSGPWMAQDAGVTAEETVRIAASPDGSVSRAELSADVVDAECTSSTSEPPPLQLGRYDDGVGIASAPTDPAWSASALGSAPSSALVSRPTQAAALQLWLPEERSQPRKATRWRRHTRRAGQHHTGPCLSNVERPLASWEPVSVAEACGYAARFAADYLSWDELEPTRRPTALRTYLADPSMAGVGWSGRGRQRADLVTTGRTVVLGEGRIVVVEVTARIVGYHRTDSGPDHVWQPSVGEATPPLAFAPAAAPPPVLAGWEPGSAWWVRIAPPIRRDQDGRLLVDLTLDLSKQS